ncbi:MAG: cupredoxin domain-containing protein [Myxococcales bacterium]|nr:cupredoxin domain-containing protein [Myxococcales bacterium]
MNFRHVLAIRPLARTLHKRGATPGANMKNVYAVTLVLGSLVALGACSKATKTQPTDPNQPIQISVTSKGFEPKSIKAHVGQPLKMVVTRKVERTCATEIVIKDFQIEQELPLNQAVALELVPTKAGPIRFACAMDMIAGEIIVD